MAGRFFQLWLISYNKENNRENTVALNNLVNLACTK